MPRKKDTDKSFPIAPVLPAIVSVPQIDPVEPLEKLLAAAQRHGRVSGMFDHEVCDLQDILRSCWDRLSPEARTEVFDQYKERVHEWPER